jgi:hypothetical protein
MKRILSVFVLLAAFASIALAQETMVVKPAEQATSGAKMVFEVETVDYGVIEQGSEPNRIFKFTNTGTEPLIIKNARGTCGCTVPSYPKEPIMPGATGEIKVKYDTNRLGKFSKNVILTTNAGEEQKTLTIKGEVVKKAEEPAGIPANENNLFNGKN